MTFIVACIGIIHTCLSATVSISGNQFYIDGKPVKLQGLRVASAAQPPSVTGNKDLTDHLIAQLDSYTNLTVNTVAVYYMGSSGGKSNPFNSDGTLINPSDPNSTSARMDRIIEECNKRKMVVIAGIFYAYAPWGNFTNKAGLTNAVAEVTRHFKSKNYQNVLINIANEQNIDGYPTIGDYTLRNPTNIVNLCKLVHNIDSQALVGGGGYSSKNNKYIGESPDVDVLFFDQNAASPTSYSVYDGFSSNIKSKPVVNVELFGAYTKNFTPPGVFPESFKTNHYNEVNGAVSRPGYSILFHNNPWCQGLSMSSTYPDRYDLANKEGTTARPGIRWYFDYLKAHPPTIPPSTPTNSQSTVSLTLIDADNDQPIAGFDPITNGAVLDFTKLPTSHLNIRANTNPSVVGSVKFELDGVANYHIENSYPYAIAGDNSGNFNAWTPGVGNHTVLVTPYTEPRGAGTAGIGLTVNFTVK